MKIALVDDRQEELDRLKGILNKKLNKDADIRTYPSGEAFLADWSPHSYDLVVLDIYMGEMTGLTVARAVREKDRDVRLVFCTTSNEFASESYDVGAHFYLHKPYSEERVETMLSRLNMEDYELYRAVCLPDGQKVMLRNVLYTEYSNHAVTLYCKKGGNIRCYMTQTQLENLLCGNPYFTVCSKGIIVNLHEVESIQADTFRLTDGSKVPISRRRAAQVKDAFAAFRFEKMREGAGV